VIAAFDDVLYPMVYNEPRPADDPGAGRRLTLSVTISDGIFQTLVRDILSGAAEPGARLDEPSMCRKFGVSRTPIREALRKLSGTGLVDVTPRRGVTVAQVDVHQLNTMFEALAEFDGLCARLSAARMTTLERKRLDVWSAGRQTRYVNGGPVLVDTEGELFKLIYEGARNPSIASVAQSFRLRLAPFCAAALATVEAERSSAREGEIVRSIVASDTDRSHSLTRDHVIAIGLQAIERFSINGSLIQGRKTTVPMK